MIVNELLTYILHSYKSNTCDNVKRIIVYFYNSVEIITAKEVLWDICKEHLGSYPLCHDSPNRLAIVPHTEDIFDAIKSLDEKNKLPDVVAQDLGRIPNMLPEELNILAIITRVAELEKHRFQTNTTLESVSLDVMNLRDKLNENTASTTINNNRNVNGNLDDNNEGNGQIAIDTAEDNRQIHNVAAEGNG